MTVLSVAEHLTHVYPLSIVFDDTVAEGIVLIDHKAGVIRVHSQAGQVKAGGQSGWSNWRV
jgi:hypothetical protein